LTSYANPVAALAAIAAPKDKTLVNLNLIAVTLPRKCAVTKRRIESVAKTPARTARGASSQIFATRNSVAIEMKAPPK
jgi:hypothetical protein